MLVVGLGRNTRAGRYPADVPSPWTSSRLGHRDYRGHRGLARSFGIAAADTEWDDTSPFSPLLDTHLARFDWAWPQRTGNMQLVLSGSRHCPVS